MEVEEYLGRSRLYRSLRSGPHGQFVERYAARLVEERLVRHGTRRCLKVVGGLLSWIAGRRYKLVDLDEQVVERCLRYRSGGSLSNPATELRSSDGCRCYARNGRSRVSATISHPARTDLQRVRCLLRSERGLSPSSISRSSRFLREVCSGGALALCKIGQEDVIRYIERHAQDWSPGTGEAIAGRCAPFSVTSIIGG